MSNNIIEFWYEPYGGKMFFIFDSDSWKDRIFIDGDNPLEAFKYFDKFMCSEALFSNHVNMKQFFNMIIKQKAKNYVDSVTL